MKENQCIYFKIKKSTNKKYYHINGSFSKARGIEISLGNIWYNVISEELNEFKQHRNFDLNFIEYYLNIKIINSIIHETFHKAFSTLFWNTKNYDKMQRALDNSEILDKLIDELTDIAVGE
jgi:hypothetical protein